LKFNGVLSFVLPDEVSAPVGRVWDEVLREGAWVPVHWRLEVANALSMAVRTRRVDADFVVEAIADLSTCWIKTDSETVNQSWAATLGLSRRHGLTLYDAAYLEQAVRRKLLLATLERELRTAAKAEGVALMAI
jgi:predicted nucleic acid-binding protein